MVLTYVNLLPIAWRLSIFIDAAAEVTPRTARAARTARRMPFLLTPPHSSSLLLTPLGTHHGVAGVRRLHASLGPRL